jgi:hypothetical protein
MLVIKWAVAITSAVLIAACGGGGGSPGATPGTPITPIGGSTVTIADFQASFSKPALTNAAADSVTLDVLALNAANNTVPGASVQVSVDSQAVFVGVAGVTDGGGAFSGAITTPVNKANRVINVAVTVGAVNGVGGITKNLVLPVVGSRLSITPVPGAPNIGESTLFNLSLLDAAGTGIPNADLTVSGSFGFSGAQPRTNLNGDAAVTVLAPAMAGSYTFSVSASGITTSRVVNVVGGVGAIVVPPAALITNASVNANPTNINQNLTANPSNKSEIKFQMIDPATNLGVENVRVRFSLINPLFGGESLSTGSSIVLTNNSGIATSDYISGLRTSSTNGVLIRACYAATDAALAGNACPNSKEATLTVGGEAVSLSIITENLLARASGNALYIQQIVIQVGDSAGNAVPGAAISASIDITHYGKGVDFSSQYPRTVLGSTTAVFVTTIPPTVADTYTSGTLGNTDTDRPDGVFRVWCVNEDINRNGVVDGIEDIDRDNVLEPRRSEIIIIPVGSGITDANGVATFNVQWGQNVGTWLAYTVKATARVSGSEGTNSSAFVTDVLAADVPNGTFLTPPYGVNNCRTNN